MITKELTKTTPPLVSTVDVTNLLPYKPQVSGNSSPLPAKIQPLHTTWPKLAYAHWVEQVKETFHKGQYVTFKKNPIILNRCPLPYYIMDIQEMHLFAEMDLERNTPKAIAVAIVGTSTCTWKTPDELRPLTEDEITSGYLRIVEKEYPENDSQIITNPNAY